MIEVVLGETPQRPDTEFVQRWAEGSFDRVQIAQIGAIKAALEDYALNGWRRVADIDSLPPRDVLVQAFGKNEGLQLLRLTPGDDWRTNTGQPSKPPSHWMPAPNPPE